MQFYVQGTHHRMSTDGGFVGSPRQVVALRAVESSDKHGEPRGFWYGNEVQFERTFLGELWLFPTSKAPWYFVTLPLELADEICDFELDSHVGFRSVRVEVLIQDKAWKTSLFPDKKAQSYVLPIKKEIREQFGLDAGDTVQITIRLII